MERSQKKESNTLKNTKRSLARPLEKLIFEVVNFELRHSRTFGELAFPFLHKAYTAVRSAWEWSAFSSHRKEERMQAFMREFLLNSLSEPYSAEFRKFLSKKQDYPYNFSNDLLEEIWDILRDRTLGQTWKVLKYKQYAVSDAIWDIKRAYGEDDVQASKWYNSIWDHFDKNEPIGENDLLHLFGQFLLDRLTPYRVFLRELSLNEISKENPVEAV